ncbi:MAG: hypothetical protein EOO71_22520 [Myxococcaceae bacterium]|nr:MAG: hypothetical protein EOO71_22520 [Myxococcaceae bacterium]
MLPGSSFVRGVGVGGLLLGIVLAGCSSRAPAPGPIPDVDSKPGEAQALPQACNPNPTCAGSTCAASITPALSTPPPDACPRFGESQSDVDVFSWNSFIALNWPADVASCTPDTQGSILSGKGPTVWETFPEDSDLFVAQGSTPGAWCTFNTPAALQKKLLRLKRLPESGRLMALNAQVGKVLVGDSKVSAQLAEKFPDIAQAVGGPLTDQHGRFVRYEKRVNQDEYNYLMANTLWSAAGQQKVKTIDFPTTPTGATEIKASWKVLSAQEAQSGRFYMRQAWVFNDDQGSPSPGANPVTVGLVGMHILHKTQRQTSWFWSTFEQVDNTTSSFFDPKCTNCQVNTQTARKPYTELDGGAQPLNAPVQVTRVTPIQADPGLNAYYRGLLRGSVWANYQLISTQWATGGAPKGTPAVLANTTMETYIQSQASCLGCHRDATTTSGVNADFSFLLGEAQ